MWNAVDSALSLVSAGNRSNEFQAPVYDILPPITALTDYATGLEKLSANGQFFVGAQMTVCNKQLKLYQAFIL